MKIKISNSFLVVLALMVMFQGLKLSFFIIFSCIIHEIGHFSAIKLCKIPINDLTITFTGGSMNCPTLYKLNNVKLVFIYAIGVVLNILLGISCYFIAKNGFYSLNFFILSGINFSIAFFNMLPIKILDGYFILKYFLHIFIKNEKKINIFCDILAFIFNLSLILVGFYYAFEFNFSILILGFYLFSQTNYTNLNLFRDF